MLWLEIHRHHAIKQEFFVVTLFLPSYEIMERQREQDEYRKERMQGWLQG